MRSRRREEHDIAEVSRPQGPGRGLGPRRLCAARPPGVTPGFPVGPASPPSHRPARGSPFISCGPEFLLPRPGMPVGTPAARPAAAFLTHCLMSVASWGFRNNPARSGRRPGHRGAFTRDPFRCPLFASLPSLPSARSGKTEAGCSRWERSLRTVVFCFERWEGREPYLVVELFPLVTSAFPFYECGN